MVVSLVEQYSILLFNGMGGINAEGINLIVSYVPWILAYEKPSVIRKLAVYATAAMNAKTKEDTT